MKTATLSATILLFLLGGCGADGAPAEATVATANATPDAVGLDAAAPLLLDEDLMRGEGCPALGAGDVAELAGVAEADIHATPAMDCYYEWSDGVVVLSLDVHRKAARAREWFDGVTGDYTADEMQAAVDTVNDGLAEKAAAGDIDAGALPAADALASAASGEGGDPLAGIGDRASASSDRIHVLLGNATFDVKAERNDRFDAGLTRAVAQRVVRNLEHL